MTVRLNSDQVVEMDIDMTKFRQDRETDTEIFGWYSGQYIAIKK